MAFPSIAQTVTSTDETDDTTQTASNFSSAPTAGNLLLWAVGIDGGGTTISVAPSGWTTITEDDNVSDCGLHIFAKESEGDENGGTETYTSGSAERSAHAMFEISGATPLATQAPEVGTAASHDAATTFDPPSLTPTGGAKDYLWFFFLAVDRGDESISAYPSGYSNTNLVNTAAAAGGAGIAYGSRTNNASSENPGTGTMSNGDSLSQTLAIHPATIMAVLRRRR